MQYATTQRPRRDITAAVAFVDDLANHMSGLHFSEARTQRLSVFRRVGLSVRLSVCLSVDLPVSVCVCLCLPESVCL